MIYHIYANQSNIGDWLSARGIQKLLTPLTVKECFCDGPFVEKTIKILSQATKDDLIIIGGGGLLMDYFEPFWTQFDSISKHIPFCIWGIGYCDLKHELSHPPLNIVKKIVNRSQLCVVRDELSRQYLSGCSLEEPVACPSINYLKPVTDQHQGLLHVANYTTVGAQAYHIMKSAAQAFSLEQKIKYRETNNRIEKGKKQHLTETLNLYKDSSIILSSGLHGCIIGVILGLKVLAVSGDQKIDQFMQSVGLKDWVLETESATQVLSKLKSIDQQPGCRDYIEKIKKRNSAIAQHIKSIL